MAAPEEKSEQNGAKNGNDDGSDAPAPGREKGKHAIGGTGLARRPRVRRRARAKKPIDKLPRNCNRNQTKNPAKHGGLIYGFVA